MGELLWCCVVVEHLIGAQCLACPSGSAVDALDGDSLGGGDFGWCPAMEEHLGRQGTVIELG